MILQGFSFSFGFSCEVVTGYQFLPLIWALVSDLVKLNILLGLLKFKRPDLSLPLSHSFEVLVHNGIIVLAAPDVLLAVDQVSVGFLNGEGRTGNLSLNSVVELLQSVVPILSKFDKEILFNFFLAVNTSLASSKKGSMGCLSFFNLSVPNFLSSEVEL